jgi:hypothetical protein
MTTWRVQIQFVRAVWFACEGGDDDDHDGNEHEHEKQDSEDERREAPLASAFHLKQTSQSAVSPQFRIWSPTPPGD